MLYIYMYCLFNTRYVICEKYSPRYIFLSERLVLHCKTLKNLIFRIYFFQVFRLVELVKINNGLDCLEDFGFLFSFLSLLNCCS